jgi:hypothetical protein
MSADLLRRAAKALRLGAALAVVPGPWEYRDQRDDPDAFPWQVWAPESRFNAGTGFAPGTAEYIALMHPPVALAVAEWLDFEAGIFAGLVGDVGEHEAVTVARAVLREEEPS